MRLLGVNRIRVEFNWQEVERVCNLCRAPGGWFGMMRETPSEAKRRGSFNHFLSPSFR